MMNMHKSITALLAGVVSMVVGPSLVSAQSVPNAPPMTVVSFGGAFARSQMLAVVRPFRESSGRWVDMLDYTGGLAQIRAQVNSYNVKWDVVDVLLPDAIRGCEEGLFERIDPAILAPAPDGTPALKDFLKDAVQPCAVGSVVSANVVAYDPARFPGDKPATLADFFDTKRFPGPRGLRDWPPVVLEWALMADGVPASQVYAELATQKGTERAFKVLDRIQGDIVWWKDGSLPPAWLTEGRVVMSQAYNGRIFDFTQTKGENLAIIWDGQVLNLEMWAIVKGTEKKKRALDFVKFATEPRRLADQAKYIAYGPARKSAMQFVDPEIRAELPTDPANMKNALRSSHLFWAQHHVRLKNRFEAWKNSKPWRPNFHPADGN